MRERTNFQAQPPAHEMWMQMSLFPGLRPRCRDYANGNEVFAERPSGALRVADAGLDRHVTVYRLGLTMADAVARQGPL